MKALCIDDGGILACAPARGARQRERVAIRNYSGHRRARWFARGARQRERVAIRNYPGHRRARWSARGGELHEIGSLCARLTT